MSVAEDYMQTVGRLEPDVSPVDRDGALTSIAISLKRIADTMDRETVVVNEVSVDVPVLTTEDARRIRNWLAREVAG